MHVVECDTSWQFTKEAECRSAVGDMLYYYRTYLPACEIENDNLDAYLHDDEEDLGQGV